MPVGGFSGRPPLETAFVQTQPRVVEILQRELRIALEDALSAVFIRGAGTIP